MSKAYVRDFFRALDQLEDRELLYYKIRYDIAPTLAGIKPSSLMTFFNHKREMLTLWDCYKEEICKKLQVRYYELRRKDERCIVLFYRDESLTDCLMIWKNKAFLKEQGYGDLQQIEDGLCLLKKRFEEKCPHELGIFLGYPVEDVTAFIESNGAPCLACKYWKVYQDVENALKTFEAYDIEREKVVEAVLSLQRKSA
ncbi:MAG: DUF3793 family protein [Desulfitobacterium sp.]